jgi:thiol:disulfide interchange protein DsbD
VFPKAVHGAPGDTVILTVRLSLSSGWYTYSLTPQLNADGIGPEPLQITAAPPSLLHLAGTIHAPKPHRKYDEGFQMEVEYYTGSVTFRVPVQIVAEAPGAYTAQLSVVYQVCDSTRCLPPEEVQLPVYLIVQRAASGASAPSAAVPSHPQPAPLGTSAPRSAALESASPREPQSAGESPSTAARGAVPDNLWLLLSIAAGAGGFALLTPCVFPMIPITVSFFTKRAERNRRRILRDALLYALGIMVTFVGLGFLFSLLFGATGIQEFATNPWVNLSIAALFVAFALNLFGAYELMLPPRLLNRLQKASERHGTLGVLLMGLTFSLTSFTCTVPFVGTALVAIAGGKWFYPLVGMSVFAAVFAAPFFLLALFPAALAALPRAGAWMNAIKVVMGFLELAAAVKFLSNADLVWGWGIMPRELFLASWIACGVLIVLYLLGIFRLPHDTPVEHVGPVRVLAAVFFGTLTLWLTTGLWGAPLGELDAFLPPREYSELIRPHAATVRPTSQPTELSWYDRLDVAFAEARQQQAPIFIDFTGFTCTNCRWMETNVFSKPQVRALLERMVRVRLFTDRRTEPYLSNKRFQQERFGTVELPFYAILSPTGEILATAGFTRDIDAFTNFLRRGLLQTAESL